ncbi:MAG: nucleotidyltransferase family protein [Ignavibacteria bacterium]
MRKTVAHIISILRDNLVFIKEKYHVDSVDIFGSYIRAEETAQSDIDILVTFTETPSLLKFIELENFLSDLLGIRVDLVMKDALKRNMRRNIIREARPV